MSNKNDVVVVINTNWSLELQIKKKPLVRYLNKTDTNYITYTTVVFEVSR